MPMSRNFTQNLQLHKSIWPLKVTIKVKQKYIKRNDKNQVKQIIFLVKCSYPGKDLPVVHGPKQKREPAWSDLHPDQFPSPFFFFFNFILFLNFTILY